MNLLLLIEMYRSSNGFIRSHLDPELVVVVDMMMMKFEALLG